MSERRDRDVAAIALLAEPLRRQVYDYVCSRFPDAVTRDEVASAVEVSRNLAAFHLDRLAGGGLLEVTFRRVGQRSGPGAGRPSKLYVRSGSEVTVSVPAREYEFAADILARAAHRVGRRELLEEARTQGRRLGAEARARTSSDATLADVLAERGFEPERSGSEIRLRNCPFHALSRRHSDVICAMNMALMEGLAEGVDTAAQPHKSDVPGYCCVAFTVGEGGGRGDAPRTEQEARRLRGLGRLIRRNR